MNCKCTAATFLLVACVNLAAHAAEVVTSPNRSIENHQLADPVSQDFDTPPRIIKGKAPIYPISLNLSGGVGVAVIQFTIGTDGRTKDIEVESTSDQKFADHAIIALKEWRFQPAVKDGVAVELRSRQEFKFEL